MFLRCAASAIVCCALMLVPNLSSAQVAPTSNAAITGSVTDATAKPIAGALVKLNGPTQASTRTDAHGLFVFGSVSLGTYEIAATAPGLGTATRAGVSVQNDTDVTIQFEPATRGGLKVIGGVSTTVNARFNVTPASVTQIDPTAKAFDGNTTWRTILEQIPGVAQAGLHDGFYSGLASIPDSPMVPVQVSIDGALPYESATLLDNMPVIGLHNGTGTQSPGNGTDLSFYALNGFGAADIIRGPGASASIVDSIGGTLSLHPAGVVTRNHYDFSLSNDAYGGVSVNGLAAMRLGKLSATLTYGIYDSPGPNGGPGFLGFSVSTPDTINGRAFQCTGSCAVSFFSGQYSAPVQYTTGFVQCCADGSAAWAQHSGSIALNYALSPAVSAAVFYTGQVSRADQAFYNFEATFAPPAGYTGSLAAGTYPLSESGLFLSPQRISSGSSLLEEKITAAIGAGILRVAALQNRTFNQFSSQVPTASTQRLYGGGQLCSDTSAGCATGTFQPAVFSGESYQLGYTSVVLGEQAKNVAFNRDLLLSYETPIGTRARAGVSIVKSTYNNPDEFGETFDGTTIFTPQPPDPPPGVSQTTTETRVFVGLTPTPRTSLELAEYVVRANYHVQNPNDATGGTYIDTAYSYSAPRLGFVWRPSPSIAYRAAAGGGFAEAPLTYLVGSNGAPTCQVTDCFVTLTNVNLRPETSFSFDVGADIRLPRNTVVSFDAYRSNLFGQLYDTSGFQGTCPTCAGLPLYVTQFNNLGQSRFEGLTASVRREVPRGVFGLLSAGLTRSYVVSLPANFYDTNGLKCDFATGANCQNIQVIPNINMNGSFATAVPYAQGYAQIGYRWAPEKSIDLAATYFGNNNTYQRPAFGELDAHLRYPLSKTWSLMVAFRNITGAYDSPIQTISLANSLGAPSITGPLYPLLGEEYGPRTVTLTSRFRF